MSDCEGAEGRARPATVTGSAAIAGFVLVTDRGILQRGLESGQGYSIGTQFGSNDDEKNNK